MAGKGIKNLALYKLVAYCYKYSRYSPNLPQEKLWDLPQGFQVPGKHFRF
jgi:hypothetical protein